MRPPGAGADIAHCRVFLRLDTVLRSDEVHHRTLFTVIPDEIDVERIFDVTEEILGRLDAPHTGVIFALPVLASRGMVRRPEEDDQ